jgi:voltage-gated potassium channel
VLTTETLPQAASTDLQARIQRLVERSDLPIGLLALAVVPVLLLEDHASDSRIITAARVGNWAIWLAFCAEFFVKLWLAPSRPRFVKSAWFDLAIIAVSPPFLVPGPMENARALRAIRLLRLLRGAAFAIMGMRLLRRFLSHWHFQYVVMIAVVMVGLGAFGLFVTERGANEAIDSVGDALWWAVVTTTTGGGDLAPITPEGRLVAGALMLLGISVVGVFTATVASFFFEEGKASGMELVEDRLQRLEAKMDELLRRRPH